MIVKSGHTAWREVAVPEVPDLRNDYTDLYNRARKRWAKRRADIEAEIQARHREATHGTREALREWE